MDPIPEMPHPDVPKLIINQKGISKLLSKLKPSKASGLDDIPNRLLSELVEEIAPALAALFQQSLNSESLPKDWKKANVTPVYKKDDKHTAANYRPVLLTCVVICHMSSYAICWNDTSCHNSSMDTSTPVTQLLLTTADLAKHHDNDRQVDIGILDFSKMFNVISHFAAWIKGFLTGRTQCGSRWRLLLCQASPLQCATGYVPWSDPVFVLYQ